MNLDLKFILKFAGVSVASFFTYYTISLYLKKRKYRHIPGPAPRGILGFYLGNLIDIPKQGIFADRLAEWHEKYGSTFKIQFLTDIYIFTSDKIAIKEILVTKNYPKQTSFMKHIMFPYGERFLGYGLVTDTDEERWRHRRTLFNPGFHKHVLMTFVKQFNNKADILMEKLSKSADGKTLVDLFKEINHTTLDAIAQIGFGMNIDSVNDENIPFNKTISAVIEMIQNYLFDPFKMWNPLRMYEKRKIKKMLKILRDNGKEKIMERVNLFKNKDFNLPNDILTNILESYKDDSFDLELMIDDFVTFFFAGQETTANTLGFCFLELGKNPRVLEKALEEINQVLGERTEISYQDIVNLKYCSCIFKESLRIYPPVVIVERVIKDEMDIEGYKIPKNTQIAFSSYMNARLEKFFHNPLEFSPERFMKDPEGLNKIDAYSYFPFSMGPRNCIGQNFAKIEGVVVLAKFLQKFEFKLDLTQSWNIEQKLTIRPKYGARCFLSLRS